MRFARDETAATTMALLAECFETIGGIPAKVLADRMGCLKAGTVANVVIPTPDYVRFATHYGFRPDFCHPADPESKGIVEHLVGYSKRDSPAPADETAELAVWNEAAVAWCAEVNGAIHSETCQRAGCLAVRHRNDDPQHRRSSERASAGCGVSSASAWP